MSTIKVMITFRDHDGKRTVIGNEIPYRHLVFGDLTNRIQETEAYLGRITGMDVKIETASE